MEEQAIFPTEVKARSPRLPKRTSGALQALKAKGMRLGNPRPAASLAKGIETRQG